MSTWLAMSAVNTNKVVASALSLLLFVSSVSAEPLRAQKLREFTVADAIALSRVVIFSDDWSPNPAAGTALFSPAGDRFLIHTRRGDLKRNVNLEALWLFDTAEVVKYAAARQQVAPRPKLLAKIDVADDWGEPSAIRWLSNSHIGLIAEGRNRKNQVFSVNVSNGESTAITHGETDVASFDMNDAGVVLFAHVKTQTPQVLTVGDKLWPEILFANTDTEWIGATPLELYAYGSTPGDARHIETPAVRLGPQSLGMWLSPTGRYAITLTPATNAPPSWKDYISPYPMYAYSEGMATSDPTSTELALRTRYQLVDLIHNSVRPLLDAPSGSIAFNRTPNVAIWLNDGNSVIVSNTFLPLDVSEEAERQRRLGGPAIAEVDLKSGVITPIVWEPVSTAQQIAQGHSQESLIMDIHWNARAQRLELTRKWAGAGRVTYEGYQRVHDRWRAVQVRGETRVPARVSVELHQGMNERPKIFVRAAGSSATKILFDPNPEAEQFRFGRAEPFTWTDKNNIEWKGSLLYPTDYVPGRRYPAVVQTHGFLADEFLIDGPAGGTTAMAAQALANAGFLVLQAPDVARIISTDQDEGPRVAEGYRAGIEALVTRGFADQARIGLITFSRTGYDALHFLARNPGLLAAVTIADALQMGYVSTMLGGRFQSNPALGLTGGAPQYDHIGDWFARNPIYQLPKVRAAVRLEANGPAEFIAMWETYAVLQNSGRSVDYVLFPEGSHLLRKPAERLGSQGANVDWFRFWLQRYERTEPVMEAGETAQTLADEYIRWEKLCDMQKSGNPDKPTFCVGTKH